MYQTVYDAGAIIIEEGAPGDCAYIIEKGKVEISVVRGGQKIVLAILEEGDIFGEMALINSGLRSASVKALAPTVVSVIGQAFFREKLEQADPMISLLLRVLLQRFHEARDKLLSAPLEWLSNMEASSRPAQPGEGEDGRRDAVQRFKFINDLQAALDERQLQLSYQPIINLETGRPAGFEALIRWNHPGQGLISPDDFIRIAEDTRDIIPIGYWVFETACNGLKQLRDCKGAKAEGREPWMSINVSPIQFKDSQLIGHFEKILADSGVPPGAVKIELTESVLIDNPQQALQFIREVKQVGLSVAIDDFGTGYSSLSYLHLFPIDLLKLDRSFVSNMPRDYRSREIVYAIQAMARNLKIDLVAEGVETRESMELLSRLGCRYLQGNFYSKPVSLDHALELMNHSFR